MTDDLPTVIRQFGNQKKYFFVHLRDVIGQPEKFQETFHSAGKLICMLAWKANEI